MAYYEKQRKGWRVQAQRDGVRVSKSFPTKREAQAWAVEQETKKTLGRQHTLRQACDRYLETVSIHKRDAVKREGHRMDDLCRHFGEDRPLGDITKGDIADWRDERLKSVSGSTIQRYVNLYRNMFKIAAEDWEWISESPFKGIRVPEEAPPRQAIWRWREIRRVLRAGQARGGKTLEVTQAFHIALRTGMRLKEALAAPGGYHKALKIVTLPNDKTTRKQVDIPLTRQGARLLNTIQPFTVGPEEASVLFYDLTKQLLIKDMQFRDSRATALTHMSRRMDIMTLARISRHKDIRILQNTYYRESAADIAARI